MAITRDEGMTDLATQPLLPPDLGGGNDGSLEQQAYGQVLDWLLGGHARPGQPMPLREMSRYLGMSRTPLRAALGRLHEQGLLAYNARVGFTVATPTPGDLYELFDLRVMCETHAIRRYFVDPTPSAPAELLQLAQQGLELTGQIAAAPEKFSAFSDTDARFHRTIVQLSESPRLLDWYQALNLRVLIFRLGWTEPLGPERFHIAADEHRQIAEAMRRDEAETLRLLEAHITRVRDQTIQRMTRARASVHRIAAPGLGTTATGAAAVAPDGACARTV